MKKATTIITILLIVAILPLVIGCDETERGSDITIQTIQERNMKEAVRQTGLPAIKNFQEKKTLKMLYELRDQANLVCYAYLVNQLNGEIGQFIGKCIGYGIPASTQYSNPEKVVDFKEMCTVSIAGFYPATIPQPEPNGLFMPEGLSATWLMLINPETGEPEPVYIEPMVIVSPFPLRATE